MADFFSLDDLNAGQALLDDLYQEVVEQETVMSGGQTLGIGSEALRDLRDTHVSFGNPRNELIRLTEDRFDRIGIELSELYKLQLSQYNFYYMTINTALWPKGSAQFSRVECSLDFGPKGADEPIVQSLFPQHEWKEVLNYGGGLTLALDGNLEWQGPRIRNCKIIRRCARGAGNCV
jgi:hypothetical protein